MFLVFGDKHRTEPAPDGLTRRMQCPKCGAHTTFHERVISRQFRLYFVEMFTHGTHHVMQCGACETAFVTDELRARAGTNDHTGTVLGALQGLARKGQAVGQAGAVGKALDEAGAGVGKALGAAQARARGLLSRLKRDDRER